jgi:hypothetical protein
MTTMTDFSRQMSVPKCRIHSCVSDEPDEDSDEKETNSDETDIDDQLTDSDYETYIQTATYYERDVESGASRRRMRESIAFKHRLRRGIRPIHERAHVTASLVEWQ